nr:hypothetical protein Iba_chr06eCG8700 [Ipomoea batatas]
MKDSSKSSGLEVKFRLLCTLLKAGSEIEHETVSSQTVGGALALTACLLKNEPATAAEQFLDIKRTSPEGGQLEFIPGFFMNLAGFGALVAPDSKLVTTASFSIENALSERDQRDSPSGSFRIFWLFIMKNSVCSSVEPDSAMVVII